jgi:uncharacterized protein (TIGR02597 family)
MKLHILSLALITLSTLQAQTQYVGAPVGVVHVTAPAASDVVLSVPLQRAAVYQGSIAVIKGNRITLTGIPGWKTNQFAPLRTPGITFAIQLASGAKEGLIARVTSNTSNSLVVTPDAGTSLSGVLTGTTGDQLDLVPYWTPSTLFSNTLLPGTRLLFYSSTSLGFDKAPATTLQFNGKDWINLGTKASASHLALVFGSAFVLRNAATSPQLITLAGHVSMTAHYRLLKTLTAKRMNDNRFGYMSPVEETLATTGLRAAAGDQLLAYDNAAPGINKTPSAILTYNGSTWTTGTPAQDVTATFKLQPGQGYIYRCAARPKPSTLVWSDLPGYLEQ